MECPKCGYAMSDFDIECPRCKRLEQRTQKQPTTVPPPPPPPQSPAEQPKVVCPPAPPVSRRSEPIRAPRRDWWWIVIGVAVFVVVSIVTGIFDGSPPEDKRAGGLPDLASVRQAIEGEASNARSIEKIDYRLQELSVEDGRLICVFDLQTAPRSVQWLESEARAWATFVEYQKVEGGYVKDVFKNGVRVSLNTYFDGGKSALRWGAYRTIGGWDPAEGAKNFDRLAQ